MIMLFCDDFLAPLRNAFVGSTIPNIHLEWIETFRDRVIGLRTMKRGTNKCLCAQTQRTSEQSERS